VRGERRRTRGREKIEKRGKEGRETKRKSLKAGICVCSTCVVRTIPVQSDA
jgi:hypothetical protein